MNAVMAGWEKSPGHYQNMIKPDFTHVAFGSASAASSLNGTYWVQNFGWGTVGDGLRRGAMRPQGAREEVACQGDIPAAGDMHVDDLAMLVHRPVHVPPHSGHLHVGLTGEQAISDRVQGLHTVGLTGLEPAAFRPPAGRATKLRHSPWLPNSTGVDPTPSPTGAFLPHAHHNANWGASKPEVFAQSALNKASVPGF